MDYSSKEWQDIFDKAYEGYVGANPQYSSGKAYSDYLAGGGTGGTTDQSSPDYAGSFRTDGIVNPGTTQANNAGKEQIDPVTGQPTNNYTNAMGFAYVDQYGFPHVSQDYMTALQYAMPGTQVKNYQGNFGGGYALDANYNRQWLDLPNAVPYGNEKTGNLMATGGNNMVIGGQGALPEYDPFLVAALQALGGTSEENLSSNADIYNVSGRDAAQTGSKAGKTPGGGTAVSADPEEAYQEALQEALRGGSAGSFRANPVSPRGEWLGSVPSGTTYNHREPSTVEPSELMLKLLGSRR